MKNMKRFLALAAAVCFALAMTSCSEPSSGDDPTQSATSGSTSTPNGTTSGGEGNTEDPYGLSGYDSKTEYDAASAGKITFDGATATVTGGGATADGDKVTISTPGAYVVTGKATNGSIVVNVAKEDKVHLILENADITCSNSAAIHVMSADKVKITLADGTVNRLTDTATYTEFVNTDEPNGCLFSKDDLTINGTGALYVTGNYNNGIACKNDLRIVSGSLYVTAVNHGVRGNDSVNIAGGTLDIHAGNDGIKTSNELEKGYIYVSGGTVRVIATDDALQAVSAITVTGGKITATAEGKITNCDGEVSIATGCLTTVAE